MRYRVPPKRWNPDIVINQLATVYGVTIQWKPFGDMQKNIRGPYVHGCVPEEETVVFATNRGLEAGVEVYLHELVHVITQAPYSTIDQQPEEHMLFQFERALAKEVLDRYDYERVVKWQEWTMMRVVGDGVALGSYPYYWSTRWWKEGYRRCRLVGLLDNDNRPTFERADWWKLPIELEAVGRSTFSKRETDRWTELHAYDKKERRIRHTEWERLRSARYRLLAGPSL